MKKKKVLGLLLAASMVLSLAGCGGSGDSSAKSDAPSNVSGDTEAGQTASDESNASEESAAGGDAVTIEVWSNNRHDEAYMTAKIEEFNAANTDVQINYTILTDD